jgi:hypothetical protein
VWGDTDDGIVAALSSISRTINMEIAPVAVEVGGPDATSTALDFGRQTLRAALPKRRSSGGRLHIGRMRQAL